MTVTVIDRLVQAVLSAQPDLVPIEDQLRVAIADGARRGVRPVRALMEVGLDLARLEAALWLDHGVDYVAELPELVAPELLERIPPHEAADLCAFAVAKDGGVVTVAVLDPSAAEVLEDIRSRFPEYELRIVVTNRAALDLAVDRHEAAGITDDFDDEEAISRSEQLLAVEEQLIASGRIAEVADLLVERAVMSGASDVHIEPDGEQCVVRFRVDGVLVVASSYPGSCAQTMVNRIKILADLDVGDRRVPQDGRATAMYGGRSIDLRVVTVPSAWGAESCVIRLLDQAKARTRLADLGFSRRVTGQFAKVIGMHGGMVLATGPTGSGKTTTLYSALHEMTTPAVKTITVEDPVEYRLPGMLQVQVNRAAGFEFADALRAVLRADPDVLLVGEIRDEETARTAVGAALTGQVVMASLHASGAATASVRLLDLGIERYMVAASLRGVINQRLVRRLCRHCRVAYTPRRSHLDEAGWSFARPDRLWMARPGGCDHCFDSGYRGRAAIAEVLTVDDEVRRCIADGSDPVEIASQAIRRGMVPIRQDALQLARQGVTSLAEIERILGEVE